MSNQIQVSIVGASGYSGLELTRILLHHKHTALTALFANTSAGKRVSEVSPWFRGRLDVVYSEYSPEAACTSDVVFLALPSGEAMNLVPELVRRGKKVIDLGGDFRLRDASLYERYYRRHHTAPEHLAQSLYAFPELHGDKIREAAIVANPGCYPTGAILPLAPLLKTGIIDPENIVVSSLSGVSGAGRSSSPELSFVEVNESVKAYKVGVHQHIPEINSALSDLAGRTIRVTFVPHLIPVTRGIYTSIYALLRPGVKQADVLGAYDEFYGKAPFIRVSSSAIPEIKNVLHTNFLDIGFRIDEEQNSLSLFSVIDNLVKGAAGQAVQTMNLMFGFDETEGLL